MLGNIQINIPIDLGIIQSKNQSSLKNKEDGTKNVESNSIDKIDSITTTNTFIGNKKNVSHSPEVAIVQKHTVSKIIIAINLILTIQRSKILRIIKGI